jgi:hypothetical protein
LRRMSNPKLLGRPNPPKESSPLRNQRGSRKRREVDFAGGCAGAEASGELSPAQHSAIEIDVPICVIDQAAMRVVLSHWR